MKDEKLRRPLLFVQWRPADIDPVLEEQVIARIKAMPHDINGFVEIPVGAYRTALFRHEPHYVPGEGWMTRVELAFIREDEDVLVLFPLHQFPQEALSALRCAATAKAQLILF